MKEVSTLMIYLILAKIGGKITAFRLQKTHSGLRGPQKKCGLMMIMGGGR